WTRHDVPVLSTDGTAERMTSVVATSSGFVAGGSAGPELLDRHARFWTSPDGVTWTPAPDRAETFDDAEIRSITTRADRSISAVGGVGSVQQPTGSEAWWSIDGRLWKRLQDPDFEGGLAVSVVSGPSGRLVAVGSDLDRRNAVSWTS